MSVFGAIYDPQPVGSQSGPIRFVTSSPNIEGLEAMGLPFVTIAGSPAGMSGATHHVVDGAVQPLDGATPALPSIISPPSA